MQSKEQQKQVRSLQRKVTQIEEQLSSTEEKISQIENEMTASENLDDPIKLNELDQNLQSTRQQQDDLTEEWENLSIQLEELESQN
ncbi:hypothetical protein GCM10025857_63850 [Alicyclobacillus contaminans]|nr:hypothetical protein GCM10025857_63850 [Alicyclobacillus contaminans]